MIYCIKNILLFILILSTIGCSSRTHIGYSTFVQKLDDKNELKISTYHERYPRRMFEIPFLYKKNEYGREFYFKLYIKDIMKPIGRNHNINNIVIENFSVSVGTGEKVQLIKDYKDYSWTQGLVMNATPFIFKPNDPVFFDIKFNMNAKDYSISGKMEPTIRKVVYPLILELVADNLGG